MCNPQTAAMVGMALDEMYRGATSPIAIQSRRAVVDFFHRAGDLYSWSFDVIKAHAESEIEKTMFWYLGVAYRHEDGLAVFPQHCIGRYRVDFGIGPRGVPERVFMAVECDGHDFHERTKEQASHDRSRDRALLALGIPTMRFTGSEIWNKGYECADEVWKFARKNAPKDVSTSSGEWADDGEALSHFRGAAE